MNRKLLFIIIFALFLIVVLYTTTRYAQYLKNISASSSNNVSNVSNPISIPKLTPIGYTTFVGEYNGKPSFSITYPKKWKSINVAQLTNSEIASYGLDGDSITFNVYLNCQDLSSVSGNNITLYGFNGIETSNASSIGFYSKSFNLVLVYPQGTERSAIFNYVMSKLKLYSPFVSCS
jgi:hypothetical protein